MTKHEFPRSFPAFARKFSNEEDCFNYIIDVRWPDGFICSKCGHDQAYGRMGLWSLQCKRCDKIHSATAGTVMHRTRQPLCTWLWAAYLVVTDKRGISALGLQNQLGINRYETAFNMLHKFRAAMVDPERAPLYGTVEVDETFIGGPKPGKRGRGAAGKAIVVGAVEVRNKRPQRVRFQVIPSANRNQLLDFVKGTIEPGSTIVTDAFSAYDILPSIGYGHEVYSPSRGDDPDIVLPHLHTAFSNLKTWLMGTHHGGVSKKHLQAYLNEFVFRYNRRGNLQQAVQTLLGLTSKVDGPTYRGLYEGTFEHKNPVSKS
ncbi:MAG: IS1595 family transposase [Chloroflexi bacterium]|nr:IS1595 family transposase [Chloroflexota bacterium]